MEDISIHRSDKDHNDIKINLCAILSEKMCCRKRENEINVIIFVKSGSDNEEINTIINDNNHEVTVTNTDKDPKQWTFKFDMVCNLLDSNRSARKAFLFDRVALQMVKDSIRGYNTCHFTYGTKKSGKKTVLFGIGDNQGLISHCCDTLFHKISSFKQKNVQVRVELSMIQIYNERIIDLLIDDTSICRLRENANGVYVEGLSYHVVNDAYEAKLLINKGIGKFANDFSNLSLSYYSTYATQLTVTQTTNNSEITSKILFVKLQSSSMLRARSPNARLTANVYSTRFTSTLVFQNVINALRGKQIGKSRRQYVPYHDSVITRLIKNTLGGNCRSTMIACVDPNASYNETITTLRFARTVMTIINQPLRNIRAIGK
jgi:hypothetical protein